MIVMVARKERPVDIPNPLSNIKEYSIPGAFSGLHIERYIPFTMAGHIPIKSLERPFLLVYIRTGANAFQTTSVHTLTAMNKDNPEFMIPYRKVSISSNNIIKKPAKNNCITMIVAFP
mmetsp:Transcript_26238/g.25089  ORF Transcript_26238/g.25089 Transcript_26238/m.25089 type:complete len:118 (-) Transcript_26238:448-801(-)